MTAKGYVGSDFDLHQLVDHETARKRRRRSTDS